MAKLIVEPGRIEREYWRDLWRYRELFQVLAWRDISVRDKQTAIDVLWALIQSLLSMITFTIIIRLAKLSSLGVPVPLFVFAGSLPRQFVSASLTEPSQSLVGNANLISKIYFPRLIVPAGAVMTAWVNFLISFVFMAGTMALFWYLPPWQVAFVLLLVVLAFVIALGSGLLITSLNVKYRDFRHIIPFIAQFGLYISPVFLGSFVFVQKWGEWCILCCLHPMFGVIDGFRWAFLGGKNGIYLPGFCLSLGAIALFLWVGIWYFRKTERAFADII